MELSNSVTISAIVMSPQYIIWVLHLLLERLRIASLVFFFLFFFCCTSSSTEDDSRDSREEDEVEDGSWELLEELSFLAVEVAIFFLMPGGPVKMNMLRDLEWDLELI